MTTHITHSKAGYPVWEAEEPTKRPFRIWDSNNKCDLAGRRYMGARTAHDRALVLVRWERKVGRTFEVYDVRNGSLIGVYQRRVNDIHFEVLKEVRS